MDGCEIHVTTPDDVSINLRLGPNLDAPRVGFVAATDLTLAMGVNESGDWYRVNFDGGFAWFLSSNASVDGDCAGLRKFPDNYSEDPSSYAPEPAAESTEEP